MEPSSSRKTYLVRTFTQNLLFSLVLSGIAVGFHWYTRPLDIKPDVLEYWPLVVFLVLFHLLQWLVQKNTAMGLLDPGPAPKKSKPAAAAALKETGADREKRKNRDKRFFVHLFVLLQREGRLIDFFQEDLDRYEDAQIGAAVRSIHANCRKTMKRYLTLEPVMKPEEGVTVEVQADFDREAIKLKGNVVGEPPFSGILRHRGWQLRKISLPELSEQENPDLIAPAEVEIQ
jgi:hypothetical protein